MFKKSLLLFFFVSQALLAGAQTITEPAKPAEDEKLNKAAVDFLRETLSDVNNLRSLENRISFTSELAGLMWFRDEHQARTMFGGLISDFQQLVAQYDGQMNALGVKGDEVEAGYPSLFTGDQTERSKIERRFRTAMAVRQQIAMSIAEHDPDLAFSFYYDSLNVITNPEFRKQADNSNRYFEFQLMNMVAEKAPDKAVKFATKALANGFNFQHIEILKKIYAKDPEKAASFAADILSKIKSDKIKREDFWVVNSLISFGSQTLDDSRKDGGKKAVYTEGDLKDLSEALAQSILDQPTESMYDAVNYLSQIERYAPNRALQIKAKIRKKDLPPANKVYAANTVATGNYSTGPDPEGDVNSARAKEDEKAKNQKQMMDDVMKVGSKELPKEQRDSIIAQARKILMSTPGRDKKITGLSLLAAQVAKAGDKDLAAQIMKDAESLVNPQPKNYRDFLLTWMLVNGYASVNPDKAFPLLDEAIGRVNDTLTAFVKVGEFIDANEEMIQDGEVQVGAFGGAMISGMTRELGMADSTIKILAKADFEKTKSLTYRFERPEVRILAKMMVLRAVLGEKNASKADNDLRVMSDLEN